MDTSDGSKVIQAMTLRVQMKRLRRWLLAISISLVLLTVSWIAYARHAAKVGIGSGDISLKDIGFYPTSGEMYAERVGFVDSTLYYQATVTPDEVAWLKRVPSVPAIEVPGSSPVWWRLALWWHGRSPDIRFSFALSRSGLVFTPTVRRTASFLAQSSLSSLVQIKAYVTAHAKSHPSTKA